MSHVQVFAVEFATTTAATPSSSGARKYLAATYAEFWKAYCVMLPDQRAYYEV